MKAATTPLILLLATASILTAQTDQPAPPAEPVVETNTVAAQPAPATPAPAPAPVVVAPQASAPTTDAVREAVRRQFNQRILRQKLDEAQLAEQRRDLPTAAKLYDDCWSLVQSIGPDVEREAQITASGLSTVRMELAKEAQRHGDYKEANVQVLDVLRVNPKDMAALDFKRANDRMIEAQKGTIPSPEVVDTLPQIHTNKIEVATLVQDGRLLFQLDKLNEAEAKLKQALIMDPGNEGANYYMSLIEQKRLRNAVNERNVTSERRIAEVEKDWSESIKRDSLPVPNPYSRSKDIHTSPSRTVIMSKLDNIHFDSVVYPGIQLADVIRDLSKETQRRDPDKKGINFLLNAAKPAAVATTPGLPGAPAIPAPATDPVTGQPLPTPAAGTGTGDEVEIGSVVVKLDPGLTDIRLIDVLEAIVKSADHPIKYSLLDYGVEFSLRGTEATPLQSRIFRVDPNTFYMGLQNVGSIAFGTTGGNNGGGGGGGVGGGTSGGGGQTGGGGNGITTIPRVDVVGGGGGNLGGGGGGGNFNQGNIGGGNIGGTTGGGGGGTGRGLMFVTAPTSMEVVQQAVIAFFRTVGVDLAPPKSVFFNDRQGTLLVRATAEDLDLIEAAINALNIAPPEVNVKAKFVEISQNDNKALGFDWYLGNVLMGGGRIAGSGGTQPSFTGSPSTANPEGTFPGSVLGGTATASSTSDSLLTGGLRNQLNAPAVASLTGILTDPQFKMVLHAMEQRDGADLLNEGQVTTMSGRQAQFQVADIRTIVSGNNTGSQGGGVQSSAAGNGQVIQNSPVTINYTTETDPFGSTLDVVPYVCADGYTIQMTLIPTVTEFVGYDDPGQFIPTAQAVSSAQTGIPITGQLPLPRTRVRQVTTSCIVWDGQTVVLGGLITDNVSRVKDKLPVLGDLPLVGRLFRSESNQTQKKNLVVFVTPRIIDPAGNPAHSEDELPFAQNAIPSQRAVVGNP